MGTIAKLKLEHQKTVFKLNKKNEKLEADLSFVRHKYTNQQNLIEKLQNEKKELLSQIEQLKDQIDSSRTLTNPQYVVEQILDEKIVNKKRYYLVHWRGYGTDDDSWEPEKNLNCPYLMDMYKKSKNR